MSTVGLFACGVVVTLLALGGTALLVWGAVLDGRDERASRQRLLHHAAALPEPTHDELDSVLPPAA
jgi:hypothetical protein